jgi:hypothetical protein
LKGHGFSRAARAIFNIEGLLPPRDVFSPRPIALILKPQPSFEKAHPSFESTASFEGSPALKSTAPSLEGTASFERARL